MSELNDKLLEIKRQKDEYILPENLKKDVTVYGVTGTLESGSGGVKLFDTVEHMQQDPSPSEGDLAIVYREEIQPVTAESEFDSCIFPNTVVLDEAFTGDISGRFGAVDSSSGYFDGNVDMSSSRFRFNGFGDKNVRITYTSSDGITYTRTDGGEELQEFGVTIKYQPMRPWNDVFGNFMKIGGKYFDGLYEYKQKGQYGIPYNFRIENNTLLYDIIPFDVPSFAKSIGVNTKSGTLVIMKRDENGDFIGYYSNNSSGQSIVKYNGRLYYANSYGANCSYTDLSTRETTSLTNGQQVTVGSITTYIMLDTEMEDNDKLVYFIPSGNWEYNVYIDTYTLLQPSGGFRYQSYYFADTQLDTTPDYVYEKTFYGKGGVESGTITEDISSDFSDINAEIYNKIQKYYDTLPIRVMTDDDKTIDKNIVVLPTKSDGTSLIDTSSITNMSNMFNNCKYLTSLPLIDTSNVTNMGSAFRGCYTLSSLPPIDTSNVTNMGSMLGYCKKITTIPLLDTSNVTNMGSMFFGCSALVTVPLFITSNVTNMNAMFEYCRNLISIPQFDTSNVTNMGIMFQECDNLETVPVLNTSSVTDMSSMFNLCPNLSSESLNNILSMCIGATSYSGTKTLKYIGLSSEQATTCQSLSNYQAFVNAGWTTGY